MATVRHLDRAPIREAVVDLRVTAPALNPAELELLRNVFAADFPQCEEHRSYESLIEVTPAGMTHAARDVDRGYICRSAERHAAIIVSGSGFSFSRLHPYTEWETVVSEARGHWNTYLQHVPVESVTRLAVRFINSFTIPARRSVDAYLTSAPGLPESFTSGDLTSSMMRLLLRNERADMTARVTQLLESAEAGVSVILDIDTFVPTEMSVSDEVWDRFAELRDMKNRIFFGSLTELALEDFE